MLMQSCCTYEKFRTPTLHAYRARARLNGALAHLFQPSQGWLNEPRLSTARSDHTSQTNRALGVKRARALLRLPGVSTPLFSSIPHTRVSTRPHSPIKCCPALHSVALGPAIVQVSTQKDVCYNVMIEALDSEHTLFFYNKLKNIFYKNVNALAVANSFVLYLI